MQKQEVPFEETSHIAETPVNLSRNERMLTTASGALLMLVGLLKRDRVGLGSAALGAMLTTHGMTGIAPLYKLIGKNNAVHSKSAAISVPHQQGIRVVQTITIARPASEIYRFWRDFRNLPRLMPDLQSVDVINDTRSHWRMKGPMGITVEWDAEIVNDETDKVIGWRSLQNPYVDHAGSIRFREAPNEQGTEVQIEMEYLPVMGVAATILAWLSGDAPELQAYNALHRLKQQLEVGEIITTEGQSSGRAKG